MPAPRLKLHVVFEAEDPKKLLDAISAFCDEAWDRGDVEPSQESELNMAGWSYKATLTKDEA